MSLALPPPVWFLWMGNWTKSCAARSLDVRILLSDRRVSTPLPIPDEGRLYCPHTRKRRGPGIAPPLYQLEIGSDHHSTDFALVEGRLDQRSSAGWKPPRMSCSSLIQANTKTKLLLLLIASKSSGFKQNTKGPETIQLLEQ